LKTIVNEGRRLPDGLALDVAAGHIYWTDMGDPESNDGSNMRSDLNGKNMITIVPHGGTFTPKQLQMEKSSGKLNWSDREGMRVMRANLDGSEIEVRFGLDSIVGFHEIAAWACGHLFGKNPTFSGGQTFQFLQHR
jgi:hypothetical protein